MESQTCRSPIIGDLPWMTGNGRFSAANTNLNLLADFVAGFLEIHYPDISRATVEDREEIMSRLCSRLAELDWPAKPRLDGLLKLIAPQFGGDHANQFD